MTPAPILKHFDFDPCWVLHQDDWILVVNKPSGLLSVPGRGADKQLSMTTLLQAAFGDIHVVHRLDMDTSGVMVFARDKESHRHLSRQFQERETAKRYHALCAGHLQSHQGRCCLPMRCDWERRPLQMIDPVHGKYAETEFVLDQQFSEYFSIWLHPITGRSHQLRLHMKMQGHPILGDNLYADPISLKMASRLCLHAQMLAFCHPHTEQTLRFETDSRFFDPLNGINTA